MAKKKMMCPDFPSYEDCIDCYHAGTPHDKDEDCSNNKAACTNCVPYKSPMIQDRVVTEVTLLSWINDLFQVALDETGSINEFSSETVYYQYTLERRWRK